MRQRVKFQLEGAEERKRDMYERNRRRGRCGCIMRRREVGSAPRKRKLCRRDARQDDERSSHGKSQSPVATGALCSQIATAIRTIKRMQSGVNFIELSGQQSFARCATAEMWQRFKRTSGGGIRNERPNKYPRR